MSFDDALMTVATFDVLMEAELARGYLENQGIRCYLADAELVNTAWYLSAAMGGIKLQVAKADFLNAERLLHSRPAARGHDVDDYGLKRRSEQITEQPGRPPESDPIPQEDEESPENQAETLVNSALRAAILVLFLCPPSLHLYSLYLLNEANNRPEQLRGSYRKKRKMTAVLDFAVLLAAAALLVLMLAPAF
jgi:hypothetical protein